MAEKNRKYEKQILIIVAIIAVFGLFGVSFVYYKITNNIIQNISDLEGRILESDNKNATLTYVLRKEQQKNNQFATQIGQLTNTVGVLDKLSKTDKELLQKYSKVYFLNENYVPEDLIQISPEYLYDQSKLVRIHAKAFIFFKNMADAAKASDVNLEVISAYRSFREQSTLKSNYSLVYGTGANKFSADQGYSEHQLGTAIDFTTSELGADFSTFEEAIAYRWLLDHAYQYGFVLSYPKGNAYYQFEPWHWRFVGKGLATTLHEQGKYFYDLDQRTIDNYLINIFD